MARFAVSHFASPPPDAPASTSPADRPSSTDRLAAYDEGRHPEIKSQVRDDAWLLKDAAARWPGADDALRKRTRLLLEHACKLHDSGLTTPAHLAMLDERLETLPPTLRYIAGQIKAQRAVQQELDRLQPLVDRLKQFGRLDGPTLHKANLNIAGTRARMDAMRLDIGNGRLDDVDDHLKTGRLRLDNLRAILENAQVLARRNDGETSKVLPASSRRDLFNVMPPQAPSLPPSPSPARRLRHALSQVSGRIDAARHTAQDTLQKLAHQAQRKLQFSGIKEAKIQARQQRELALAPHREELALLANDLLLAHRCRRSLLDQPKLTDGGRMFFQSTLGALLVDADAALKHADQTIARGASTATCLKTADQSICAIRSKLECFKTGLDIHDLHPEDTGFDLPSRPWPRASAVAPQA